MYPHEIVGRACSSDRAPRQYVCRAQATEARLRSPPWLRCILSFFLNNSLLSFQQKAIVQKQYLGCNFLNVVPTIGPWTWCTSLMECVPETHFCRDHATPGYLKILKLCDAISCINSWNYRFSHELLLNTFFIQFCCSYSLNARLRKTASWTSLIYAKNWFHSPSPKQKENQLV